MQKICVWMLKIEENRRHLLGLAPRGIEVLSDDGCGCWPIV